MEQAVAARKDDRDAEDLMADIDEKLEDPEFGPEFQRTPIGVVVAILCQEYDLPYNGGLWTDEELGGDDPEWNPPREEEAPRPKPPRPRTSRRPTAPSQEYRTSDPDWRHRDIDPCPIEPAPIEPAPIHPAPSQPALGQPRHRARRPINSRAARHKTR